MFQAIEFGISARAVFPNLPWMVPGAYLISSSSSSSTLLFPFSSSSFFAMFLLSYGRVEWPKLVPESHSPLFSWNMRWFLSPRAV